MKRMKTKFIAILLNKVAKMKGEKVKRNIATAATTEKKIPMK